MKNLSLNKCCHSAKYTPFLPSHFCGILPLTCSCLLVYSDFGLNLLFCSSSRHSQFLGWGVFFVYAQRRGRLQIFIRYQPLSEARMISEQSPQTYISCRQVIYFHLPPAWEVISLINLQRQVHSCLSKPDKTVSVTPNQYKRIPIYFSMLVTYMQKSCFSINPSFIYVATRVRKLLFGVLIKHKHVSAITELQCKTSKRLSIFCLLLYHWLVSSYPSTLVSI